MVDDIRIMTICAPRCNPTRMNHLAVIQSTFLPSSSLILDGSSGTYSRSGWPKLRACILSQKVSDLHATNIASLLCDQVWGGLVKSLFWIWLCPTLRSTNAVHSMSVFNTHDVFHKLISFWKTSLLPTFLPIIKIFKLQSITRPASVGWQLPSTRPGRKQMAWIAS